MNVKGVAFHARRSLVTEEKGAAAWEKYFAELCEKEPLFRQPILPITALPIQPFLRALDLLVATVYGGDPKTWWHFGVTAGKQALTTGQLKGLFKPGESRKLLAFAPKIWAGYFDFGALTTADSGPDTVDLRITGAPTHPYFEGAVVGFASGAIELLGAPKPLPDRLSGFATGSAEVLYRFKQL
ncbi:MAG: hypothetical protein JNK82_30185 [Myxococcaceae bacterium]|nr:hypothetical protein [Myxococcaceae bacterium]